MRHGHIARNRRKPGSSSSGALTRKSMSISFTLHEGLSAGIVRSAILWLKINQLERHLELARSLLVKLRGKWLSQVG
jgi:hypothetical protein